MEVETEGFYLVAKCDLIILSRAVSRLAQVWLATSHTMGAVAAGAGDA